MNIQEIVDKVPPYPAFLTVEEMDESTRELEKEFPSIVQVFEAGTSRKGHPILCMKIGNGPKNALCFACPHPNEPIGAMTMEFFSRALAEDDKLREELGFTWYIIKCIDPDGVRLNEKWFKGPFTIYHYTKNFYRPIGYEQVEWTFPIDYKELHFHESLPETQALMNIIDETSPQFMYSLHNAGFGGAYWYLSHDLPAIYDSLRNSASKQNVSLSLGEPEEPFIKKFSPAIFKSMSIKDAYDYVETYTKKQPDIKNGTSSADYAKAKSDCVTLLAELPYFFDSRIQDMSDGEITRKEAILQNIEMNKNHFSLLDELLTEIRPFITNNNPFVKLVDEVIRHVEEDSEAKKKWVMENREFDRKAKVAELFDNRQTAMFYNGLYLGLTVRTCEYELERLQGRKVDDMDAISTLTYTYQKGEQLLMEHCDRLERELDYSVIPIQKLVQIQIESGLIVADYIKKNR